MIEADRVELLAGEPELVDTPSDSGKGQKICALPELPRRAVEQLRGRRRRRSRFVRVGTLDEPDRMPPDIHIFTASKQPWVVLPRGHAGGAGVLRRASRCGRRRAWSGGPAMKRGARGG